MPRACLLLLAMSVLPPAATAQAPTLPVLDMAIPYAYSSGTITNPGNTAQVVHSDVVVIAGAPALRLLFSQISLGTGDSLRVTSLLDGQVHDLSSGEVAKWQNSSAYFNGDTLLLDLFLQPGSSGSYTISQVIAGIDPGVPDTLCGADNRVPSNDNRSMRLVSSPSSSGGGCTIWLAGPNDCALTAGHCFSGTSLSLAEANVPPSTATGAAQHPSVQYQFPVITSTKLYVNGGQGNDWGMCRLATNSLGQSPSALFGWFSTASFLPAPGQTIRITGYGTDDGSANVTNQTSTGPYSSTSGTSLRYQVDTMGGNSGSPVIFESTGEAVGIHTHGGCTSSGTGANSGTSLSLSTFQTNFQNLCPQSPTGFALQMTTGGNGAGDFHLQLLNIPANASEGFTLFSFNTSSPVGSGNLFGITADLLTLQILQVPASPTGLFHWVAPFVPGMYPDGPFDLPPGSLPFPAGTQADGQALAFPANLANLEVTNVVRITF